MSTVFDTINTLPILDVLDKFGIRTRVLGNKCNILKDDGSVDESFSISIAKNIGKDFGKTDIKGGVFDIVGRYHGINTQTNEGRKECLELFCSKGVVVLEDANEIEFVPAMKDYEIFEKIRDTRDLHLGGFSKELIPFLVNRGFTYNFIQENNLRVGEVFKDIGFYDNYFTTENKGHKDINTGEYVNVEGDDPKNVNVLIFPCYDTVETEEGTYKKEMVGCKIRRIDGKRIKGTKSHTPYKTKTGLIYDNINPSNTVYIVEGETDYIAIKLLGYNNVIGNLGGVQSNMEKIKKLTYNAVEVVCLYDNDLAGDEAKKALQKCLGREIYEVVFPVTRDIYGNEVSDINDLIKIGYDTKTKLDKVLKEIKSISTDDNIDSQFQYIFIESTLKYYDTKYKIFQEKSGICDKLNACGKDITKMIHNNVIKSYDGLCYYSGGRKGYYNILDESKIIKNGGDAEPTLNLHIKALINNICNKDKINSDWIHRSILYKLTHLNDVTLPAVVLYGAGGTGKGLFLKLLSRLFGEENTQFGINMKSLKGSFDAYNGEKLIVEFNEIHSGNTFQDKTNTDYIKSIVGQEKLTINAKYEKQRQVDNIARFHFSSNHSTPIQLDSKYSGNRRFTIIKSITPLPKDLGADIYDTLHKGERIIFRQYVNRLFSTFPDVPTLTHFPALENEDKKNLEEVCEGVGNEFFERFERKFPYIDRITLTQKNKLIERYCSDSGENMYNDKFKQKNFDSSLSHRYEKKKLSIGGKKIWGYCIHKTPFDRERIPSEEKGFWTDEELNRLIFK